MNGKRHSHDELTPSDAEEHAEDDGEEDKELHPDDGREVKRVW